MAPTLCQGPAHGSRFIKIWLAATAFIAALLLGPMTSFVLGLQGRDCRRFGCLGAGARGAQQRRARVSCSLSGTAPVLVAAGEKRAAETDDGDIYGTLLREEDLQRVAFTQRCVLWQRKRGHRTGSDDIFCAWAALQAVPQPKRSLDLGAGHGAVSLLLADNVQGLTIDSVEAQRVSFLLLQRNIRANGFEDRVRPTHGDLRGVTLPTGTYDLITGTPPFMPMGTGVLPQDAQRAACRFELRGGIEAYCKAAAPALAPSGWLSLVMDALRPERYAHAFSQAGLTLRRQIAVLPRPDEPPTYLIYQGGHGGTFEGEQQVVVRGKHGEDYSDEYQKIVSAVRGEQLK